MKYIICKYFLQSSGSAFYFLDAYLLFSCLFYRSLRESCVKIPKCDNGFSVIYYHCYWFNSQHSLRFTHLSFSLLFIPSYTSLFLSGIIFFISYILSFRRFRLTEKLQRQYRELTFTLHPLSPVINNLHCHGIFLIINEPIPTHCF